MKKRFFAVIFLVLLFGALPVLQAGDYPDSPVKLIVPWSPGGGSDSLMRVVAKYAEKHLGQAMPIINIAGVGGTLGTRDVKDSKPDGYKIVMGHEDLHTAYYNKIADFNYWDFEAIAAMTYSPQFLVVNAESNFKDAPNFIQYAKNNPDVVMGTTMGTIPHFWGAMLEDAAGIQFRYAGYEGTGKRVTALLGNHVKTIWSDYASTIEYVKAGKLQFLAFSGAQRDPKAPEVPTFKELGYDLDLSVTRGLFAPKGTAKEKLDVLEEAFRKAAEDPEFVAAIEKLGAQVRFLGQKDYAAYLKKLDETIAKLAKKLEL